MDYAGKLEPREKACGSEVVGYRNEKDCVKLRCPKCGLVMVSKRMSRRRERIEVIAPPGEIISN